MVLLAALAALRTRVGFLLDAAHVHHGLSPNADTWADFCRRECDARGVSLQVFHVHVARDTGSGLESAARDARIGALRSVETDWLVFAHHRDDQAETVLFRLARGAGVLGAAGMVEIEIGAPGRLRPLLALPRTALAAWAVDRGLAWVEDESNADIRFARNHLRVRVLPGLNQAVPGASQSLARAAANFRDAASLLDDLAALDHRHASANETTWRRTDLLALPDRRLANLLRWRLKQCGAQTPSRATLAEFIRQLRSVGAGGALLPLATHALAIRHEAVMWLDLADCAVPASRAWDGGGDVRWGLGVLQMRATAGCGLDAARIAGTRGSAGKGGLLVRSRWPGLRMRVAANRPRRSFKNLCQEAGIPEWLRLRLPVLCAGDEAIWIAGIGCAAEWRCPADGSGLLPAWSAAGILGLEQCVH